MDSKLYLKRNINNQLAKLNKEIIFLDTEFREKLNEINIISIEGNVLSDFLQNSKFSTFSLTATPVKNIFFIHCIRLK